MDNRAGGHGFSITKNFTWIAKAFGRSLTREATQELPDLVSPTVRPVFDALGWNRWGEAQANEVSGTNVTAVNSPVFETEGFFRVVLWAGGAHDDIILNHSLAFSLVANVEGTSPIPLTTMTPTVIGSVLSDPHGIALQRPVILRPGNTIRLIARPGMGVGDVLQIQTYFVDIPEGEYIPSIF